MQLLILPMHHQSKYIMHDLVHSSSSLWLKNRSTVPEIVKKKLEKFQQHEQLLNTELSYGDKEALELMRSKGILCWPMNIQVK